MTNKPQLNGDNGSSLVDSLSKLVVLPGENRQELNKIKRKIEMDLKPVGAIEEILCSKIISDNWKLRRFYALETQILRKQQTYYRTHGENLENPWEPRNSTKRFRSTIKQIDYSAKLESIQKHQTMIEAGLLKTISELKMLQKDRIKVAKQ